MPLPEKGGGNASLPQSTAICPLPELLQGGASPLGQNQLRALKDTVAEKPRQPGNLQVQRSSTAAGHPGPTRIARQSVSSTHTTGRLPAVKRAAFFLFRVGSDVACRHRDHNAGWRLVCPRHALPRPGAQRIAKLWGWSTITSQA